MMKFCCICFCTLALLVKAGWAAPFVEGFEDIPVPDNMKQIESDNVAFGNAETSLTEAYLQGNVSFDEVNNFYLNTLPQLGWEFSGKNNNVLSFRRDNQLLEIAKEGKNPLVIRITVKSWN